jgi:DNA helicase-2/ATP-dependent DNA helicase PcrA
VLGVANTVLGAGLRTSRPLRAQQGDGPVPTVRSYGSDADEAQGIARAVRDQHAPGTPWSHAAVLTRTNAQLVLFEEAFRAARIPYRVRNGGAFLRQPEVREVLADLRRSPSRAPLAAQLADLEAMAGEPAGSGDGDDSGGGDAPAGAPAERRLHLEALVRLGREYAGLDATGSVEGFLAWLAATVGGGDEPDRPADAVELATFHRAKGLEWPVVFLAGLERGLVPIGQADTPDARAEERRLLYVAITRAQRQLHCSWAERRTFGGRTVARQPSPWLATIEAAVAALEAGGPDVDWRRLLDAERDRLRAAGARRARREGAGRSRVEVGLNADPAILAALKTWRAGVARASGMPAYVIFHDTTLAAVAEARPRTADALLALPGVGPVKVARYGPALLSVVAEHTA